MLSLHKATSEIKTTLKWGSIIIGSILMFFIILKVGGSLKELFFPTPPPPPTVSFGKLSKISFPINPNPNNFTYILNNLTGKLPIFPDRINVYKILPSEMTLLSLEKAQEKISKIGFNKQGVATSEDSIYKWEDGPKKLILDISSLNFNFSSDYYSDKDVLNNNNLDENKAVSIASTFLSKISFPDDLDLSKTKTILLSIKDSKLIPVSGLSSAKLIRLDFFQKNINNLPIFYATPFQSTIYAFIGSGEYEGKVVAATLFHQNISKDSATYPLKTADEAFNELKSQKGYIASYFGEEKEIQIKNVFLGYFMNSEKQNYLMPIIIFEGNNGFFAYVSAIKDDWLE